MNHALASVIAAQRGGSSYGGRGSHCTLWEAKGLGPPAGSGGREQEEADPVKGRWMSARLLLEVRLAASRALPPVHV